MPDEDTQVLDEAPSEESEEEAPLLEAVPPLTEDGEVDYKTLADQRSRELTEERAELRRLQTRLGRLETERFTGTDTVRQEMMAQIGSLRRHVSLLVEQQADPMADPEEFRRKYADADTEIVLQGLVGETTDILSKVQARATDIGADMSADEFASARNQWEQARKVWGAGNAQEAMRGFYRADASFQLALDRMQAEQEAEDQRKSNVNQQRRNGNLNVTPGSAGAAGGMTAEQRWTAYGRGEVAWSKEVQEAGRTLGAL